MSENLIQSKAYTFALSIFSIYRQLKQQHEYSLADQILRSATSIGANVEEAIGGYSKAEFAYKMSISLKEARETKYWLRLLHDAHVLNFDIASYMLEIESIINILYRIVRTASQKNNR